MRSFSRKIGIALFAFLSVLLLNAPLSLANTLAATDSHKRATELITDFLNRYHYRKIALNDEFSEQIFDTYLTNLDPTKSYFRASDIAQFALFEHSLDDDLKDADLSPAYRIFSRYVARVEERVAYAQELLEGDFDFDQEESFRIDRKEASWLENEAEQNEFWRKRVKNDVLSLRIAGKEPDEIKKTLTKRYQGLLKRSRQLDTDDVYQLYINAYATSIDPHTSYLSPRTYDNFEIRMSLSLEGIGALLRTDGEYTVVERIIPGGPADISDLLHAKDKIVGISQTDGNDQFQDVIGWRLEEVVQLIRGPKDTVVHLQILPGAQGDAAVIEEIKIKRNKIKLEEQAAKKEVIEIPRAGRNLKIGVIDIPTFYLDFAAYQRGDKDFRSTTRDVRKLLDELTDESVDSLVLDLRGNGGGSLIEATQLAGLFIRSGPVVQVRDSSGHVEIQRDRDSSLSYSGPMVILVDRFSASASEIVASALQDYRRAVIVGETTFGKGSVQQLIDLNNLDRKTKTQLGQLKATIAQYFRISGEGTQHRGVVPDIVFNTDHNKEEHGERSMDNALPWSQITPVRYRTGSVEESVIDSLFTQHQTRVSKNEKYASLMKLYELNTKVQTEPTISLKESARKERFDYLEEQRLEYEKLVGIDAEEQEQNDLANVIDVDNDVLLNEAAQISADLYVRLMQSTGHITAQVP